MGLRTYFGPLRLPIDIRRHWGPRGAKWARLDILMQGLLLL